MRLPQHDHQARDEPARNQANLLDQAFFDPEKQLVRFLQHAPGRHSATSPAVPTQSTFLIFDGLLQHDSQPTISAGYRGSGGRWTSQSAPSPSGSNQVHLAVEGPLSPLLANAVTHDHPRDVAVRAMMHLVGPA